MLTLQQLRCFIATYEEGSLTAAADRLGYAQPSVSEQIRNLFLSALSERAGKLLRDEIASLGPIRLRDVDEAQAQIVALAKDLAQQGEIEINDHKDEQMVL